MHLRRSDVHKHAQHTIWTLTTISALLIGLLNPVPAAALDVNALVTPSLPSALTITRPLPQVPDYSYVTSGSVIAAHSPVTLEAQWPKATFVRRPQATIPAQIAEPTHDAPLVLEGEASYYSRAGCLGCSPALRMANGQPLDDNALTMAIGADKKHLVGHTARVTNLVTDQSVMVVITDTGGFYQAKYGHRVADLTIATKNAIGMAGGVGQVRVEVF